MKTKAITAIMAILFLVSVTATITLTFATYLPACMHGGGSTTDYSMNIVDPVDNVPLHISGGENVTVKYVIEDLIDDLKDIRVTKIIVGGVQSKILEYPGNKLIKVGELEAPRCDHSDQAVALNGKVYIVGGEYPFEEERKSSILEYDTLSGTSTKVFEFTSYMYGCGVVGYGGKIYILGGTRPPQEKTVDDVLVYDPSSKKLELAGLLPFPICYFGATVIDDKIYAVGGLTDTGTMQEPSISDKIVEFDPLTNTSKVIGHLPSPNSFLGATSFEGKIVIMGGLVHTKHWNRIHESTDQIVIYDPKTNSTWYGDPLPTAMQGLNPITLNERIYTFGGIFFSSKEYPGEDGPCDWIIEFDPLENKTRIIEKFPSPRASTFVVKVYEKIYVFGGWRCDGRTRYYNDIFLYIPQNLTAKFEGNHWETVFITPDNLAGPQNLFLEAMVTDHTKGVNFLLNDTELNALVYSGKDYTPYLVGGGLIAVAIIGVVGYIVFRRRKKAITMPKTAKEA